MHKTANIKELQEIFSDLLNYSTEGEIDLPINPIIYKTPEGDTCLHIACIRGNMRTVKLLLEEGVDINELGDMNRTALHYSKSFGHIEIYEYLLNHGAESGLLDDFGSSN